MCTQCGGAEEASPTVTYGASAAKHIFNEPALPASSVVPASAAPAATVEPPMSVASNDPTSPPPASAGPAAGAAGAGAPINTMPLAGAGGAAALPVGGNGAADGAAGAAMPVDQPAAQRPTTLGFEFTSVTQNGKYAPVNIGAVWVESASGQWVHTLEYWGNVPNDTHLNRYLSVSGPDYASFFGIPVTKVPPDVVTSATLQTHKTHSGLSWNLENASGSPVPDGMYTLVVELTEATSPGQFIEIPFEIGPGATAPTPPSSNYYTGIKLTLQ